MELAIGIGQRLADLLKMKWSDIEDGGGGVTQNKTETELWIPFTSRLKEVLAQAPRKGFYIIADEHGRALNQRAVQARILKIRKKVGLEEYQIHGWRYTAASQLSTAGATDAEIAAITGHKSVQMVAKYSRKHNQRKLAQNAQRKRDV
jgi:integrase